MSPIGSDGRVAIKEKQLKEKLLLKEWNYILKVKPGTVLKLLNPNKLLTRFPVLLGQIKAGNNSCKLKNEINTIKCC